MSLVDARLEAWKSRLLDLSKRNRLLFYRHVKRGNVQIVEPGPDELFAWLVRDGKKLTFTSSTNQETLPTFSEDHPTLRPGELRANLSGQQLESTLYNIRSRSRAAVEEQGVNILYLTLGMLEWYEAENSQEKVCSPLMLIPVDLARSSITKPYTLELLDEEILLNPTLARKMELDFRITFPDMPEDWESLRPESMLDRFRTVIKGQPRWAITSEIHLGLFSFEKLVMLRDIEAHTQDIVAHPLVAALAGDPTRLPTWSSDAFDVKDLDTKIVPEQTFQVLDADSSQQEAIMLAKRGISFVIQGPPGTGKSQTIVNLIAEGLAQGKKVLFVSEKMAALQVVYKRLEECGLAEFCLEAHSHKVAKKSAIVETLGRSLQVAPSVHQPSSDTGLKQVVALREKLDSYAEALHKNYTALHRTPFQIHGELARLDSAPSLSFTLENIAQTDVESFLKMQETVASIAAMRDVWDTCDSHPWRGTLVQELSFHTQTEIQTHFGQLVNCLSEIESTATQLAEMLGMLKPTTWGEIEPFCRTMSLTLETPFPPAHWLMQGDLERLRKVAIEAQQAYGEYETSRANLLSLHSEAIFTLPGLPALMSRFSTDYSSILRVFNAEYRKDLRIVKSTAVGQHRVGYAQALAALRSAVHVLETRQQKIDGLSAHHQRMFGRFYDRMLTRWEGILAAVDWCERLLERLRGGSPSNKLVGLLCDPPKTINGLKNLVLSLQAAIACAESELAYLATVFPVEHMSFDGERLETASIPFLKERVQLRLDHLSDLGPWVDFQTAWKTAERGGLGSFLKAARQTKLRSSELSAAFTKRFYQLWLDVVYQQVAALREFRGDQHARWIEQFRSVDQGQLQIAHRRLIAQLAASRPNTNWVTAPSSEVMILRREAEKKKRHKPIRRLFSEIPNLLLALKPCLMMSPLSVSQFLSSGSFQFDMVIFDEASQICPEDAIGSIMRSKQTIVAGDKHQLPPTSFFKSLGIDYDEWEDDAPSELLESLLQEWSVSMPNQMLKWHYRSRHESLIAFSNYHIYDNRLVTFPNSKVSDDGLGLEFVHVPGGTYDRGKSRTNRVEARHVAALILYHFKEFPDRSLGVVAFSEAQREAIDDEIQCLAREKPAFESLLNREGPERFFVKNLESVQGDERDVMFFSVGYGKDALGRMTMNFGPLNGEDGARRLNVAITRARYHVKLVASILPEDIDSASTNRGVQLLRKYMEYTRQGGKRESLYAATDAAEDTEVESPFEAAVYQALTERGLIVHKQVGCSGYRIDLAVVDPDKPGRYLLGIECDGATYHSAQTARDRDRLRQQVLEGLGWRIHRIWSRDWIANSGIQVQKVLDVVSQERKTPHLPQVSRLPAVAVDVAPASVKPYDDRTRIAVESVSTSPHGKAIVAYRCASLPTQGGPQQFYESDLKIRQLLLQLVKEESPVHFDVACRRIARCWDIERAGCNVEAKIRDAAKRLQREKSIEIRDEFLWTPGLATVIVRQPPDSEAPRPIGEIAIVEITQAAFLCLQDALSLTPEDLIVQTARVLGYDRTGKWVKQRIQLAVDQLVRENRAILVNGRVETVTKTRRLPG